MDLTSVVYAHGGEFVCRPGLTADIAAARDSVQARVDRLFSEISDLQLQENFLDNVAEIQERDAEIGRLRVQRDQIASVEECAKDCSCEAGAHEVLDEYNAFAVQRGEEANLVPVKVSTAYDPAGLLFWGAAIVVVAYGAWYVILRRMRRA